jgi:predicted permease
MAGLQAGDSTRRIFLELISANYFDTLQVPLAAGRTFRAEEERPEASIPVIIVPYERWRARGLDPAFIGSTMKINSIDFTVVGVAPPKFGGTMALISPEGWLPLGVFDVMVKDIFNTDGKGLADRTSGNVMPIGRLKPGVTLPLATAQLDVLARQLEADAPAENKGLALTVSPLPRMSSSTEPQTDTGIGIVGAGLMGLAGTVLLIACLNLANMLLARGTTRRKEIAIRLALGGTRRRVIRQLLTENLVLALAGAALGLLFASWATGLLGATLSAVLPLALVFEPRPDLTVLAVTTAFAVLATLIAGLGPALKLSRLDLVPDLKEHAADAGATGRWFSARNVLVVAQLALSLALLTTGGLFARSALHSATATPGFSYERGLMATIDASMAQYDESKTRATYRAMLERLRATPGIEAVSVASTLPFSEFHEGRAVERLDRPAAQDRQSPTFRIIGHDYFKALGMPMLRGREFTTEEEESPTAPQVTIIDERLAHALFPNEDPIGQMIRLPARDGEAAGPRHEPLQVVGVSPSTREELFDRAPVPHVYVPAGRNYRAGINLHIRASAGSDERATLALVDTVRRELRAFDPRLPVLELTTLRRFHDRSLALWGVRMGGRLLTIFGVLALVLAVAGVYGVKAYLVSRRTREIGIRMALGADRSRVLGMVLRDAAWLSATGIVVGLPIALLLGRAMSGMLFGVSGYDPLIFTTAPLVLGLSSMLASYIPARRATRVNPLSALRAE